GYTVMGVGFIILAAIPSVFHLSESLTLSLMMVTAAVAAIGGPMNDLAHFDVLQKRFAIRELVRVMRLRMAMEYGGMLICLLAAPLMVKLLSAQWMVGLA